MAEAIPIAAAAFTLGGLFTLLILRRSAHRCAVCQTDLSPVCDDRAACNRRAADVELARIGT